MPKEVIYGDSRAPAYGTPEQPEAITVTEISWSREAGHVQIASKVIRLDTHDSYIHESFQEYLKHLPEDERLGVMSMMAGIYTTLDRDAINSIIRVLRRARDQAFGRDE